MTNNTTTRMLFDSFIRHGKYSNLDDVQNRIDYYVARQVIDAEEAKQYMQIARERVAMPENTPDTNAARIEYLEAAILDIGNMFAELMGGMM